MSKYLPLESNPDMLTEFIRKLGVLSPTRFVDIWSFDDETIELFPQPMLAVCVLYPSDVVDRERAKEFEAQRRFYPSDGSKCLYIKQRMEEHGNACGTIAVLHAICNNVSRIAFAPNSPLLTFAQQLKGLDSEAAADVLSKATDLHSVTSQVAATGQTETPGVDDEVNYHFIAFIRSDDGHLLEMDGGKKGPVDHGTCPDELFFRKCINIIRDDMMKRDPSSLQFSALGLTTAPEDD